MLILIFAESNLCKTSTPLVLLLWKSKTSAGLQLVLKGHRKIFSLKGSFSSFIQGLLLLTWHWKPFCCRPKSRKQWEKKHFWVNLVCLAGRLTYHWFAKCYYRGIKSSFICFNTKLDMDSIHWIQQTPENGRNVWSRFHSGRTPWMAIQ